MNEEEEKNCFVLLAFVQTLEGSMLSTVKHNNKKKLCCFNFQGH